MRSWLVAAMLLAGCGRIAFGTVDDAGGPPGSPDVGGDATTSPGGPTTTLTEIDGGHGVAVAWNGSEFGIAWSDFRTGTGDIFFARLDDNGQLIGNPMPVTSAASSAGDKRLLWTGSSYALAWTDLRDGTTALDSEVYFTLLDATGGRTGLGDVRITNASGGSVVTGICGNAAGFAITWYDERDTPTNNTEIYAARVDGTGTKLGGDVRITSQNALSQFPSIACTPAGYTVVWSDSRDGNSELYVTTLDATISTVAPAQRLTTTTGATESPQLVGTGTEVALAWLDEGDRIWLTRLAGDGTRIAADEALTPALPSVHMASIAVDDGIAMARGAEASTGWFIGLTHVDGDGLVTAERRVSDGPSASSPALAWSGSRYAVAWTELVGTTPHVRVRTVLP